MKNNYKTYKFLPLALRIILASILIVWIPLMTVITIKKECSNEMIIFTIVSTIIWLLLSILSESYGITISDERVVVFEIKRRIFKNELIENIKLDDYGTILITYEGKVYKIRGVISLITQDSNDKKNQEIVEYILKRINKEELIYTNTDEVVDDKDMKLF